jgi:hypothetical protein
MKWFKRAAQESVEFCRDLSDVAKRGDGAKSEAAIDNSPGLQPIGAKVSKCSEKAKDWWGEAPELTQSSSKELGVVGSVSQKAEKLPSRGPACRHTHNELTGRRIEPRRNANR